MATDTYSTPFSSLYRAQKPVTPSTAPVAQPVAAPAQADYNTARQTYATAAANALPSQASMDNAAARVRARLAGQAAGQRRTLENQLAGGMKSQSGIGQYARAMQANSEQSALGSALSDLQNSWWDKQQSGANVLAGIGSQQAGLGSAINADQNAVQKLANDYALSSADMDNTRYLKEQELEDQKQQSIRDQLLSLGSLFGQFGKINFGEGTRGDQWETIIRRLLA